MSTIGTQVSFADMGTPLERATFVVVDLETTGGAPGARSLTEIGAVKVRGGQVLAEFSTLVNPGVAIPAQITMLTGITNAMVAGAPGVRTCVEAFLDWADLLADDVVLVAHNARFDVGFLTQALGTQGLLDRGARVPRVCTMEWARHFMTTPSRRLTTCCEVAGVEIGRHHNALDDALAAAGLLRHYLAVGAQRGEEPVAWARSLVEARRFAGWHWDAARARAGVERLTARTTPGAERPRPGT